MAYPGLLRGHADFRRLWVGDGLSKLGSQVVVLAMPLLAATTLGASTWEVGLLAAFASLPFLLIGLPVGAWADRVRRRPVLVAADLGRAAVLAWVPVAALLGVLTVEQLYAVELLVGVGNVFFDVSQGAYLPALVGRARLVEANGRLEANRTVAYSAGPTVGGQLVQWLGAPLAAVATVLGFLWSAAWIASIRTGEQPPRDDGDPNLRREIRDGLRFVLGQPYIRATTFHATTAVLFLSTLYAVQVLFLLRTLGLSPGAIGALMTIVGLGSVAGAVLANRLARRLGRTRTVLLAGLGIGLSSLLIPLADRGLGVLWFATGAALLAGAITVTNVVSVSLRQLLCPDQLLGRMNATTRFLAWATLPLGGVAGGAFGTALGLRTTIWLAAVGLLLSWLWLALSPACRARDLPVTRATISGMDSDHGHVTSRDGTSIAYERIGTGPAVILVGGGLTDRSENAPLAPELAAAQFTVYNYDRRGRGASGDTQPYALERELEDLAALITEAGGSAHLYGVSTGGALALEAAAAGLPVDRLAVYEVPYNLADDWPARWREYADQLRATLAAGRRGDAFALFLRLTGSSEEEIAGIRSSPFWPDAEALAHTLPYDAACLGDGRPPTGRLAKITQPALVATGVDARQPGAAAWVLALDPAADAVVASLPHAERRIFEGQSHVADPAAVAPVLARFFGE